MQIGYTYEFYQRAASFIKERLPFVPKLGIILGTGCGPFASRIQNPTIIKYSDIPGFLTCTSSSHKGELVVGQIDGEQILCLNGRFHFYEGYSMEELAIPVNVLYVLGVRTLILTNASGSCNPQMHPGEAMILKDHIKLYGGSPLRGPNLPQLGKRCFGVYDIYTKTLRTLAKDCAKSADITVHEGVYMFFPGPQFETASEIKAARILGADVIGMSTVTEALTACHCNMKLLAVALITNWATGMTEDLVDGSEVEVTASQVEQPFSDYLVSLVKSIAKLED